MLDLAPPGLKQKMEGEIQRQQQEKAKPARPATEERAVSVSAGSTGSFLRGTWVFEPFRANCGEGSSPGGRYEQGINAQFEMSGSEVLQSVRTWGGPGYNNTNVTRYQVLSTDTAKKKVTAGIEAQQIAQLKVKLIDTKVTEGSGRANYPKASQTLAFLEANDAHNGYRGRVIRMDYGGLAFSCDGSFRQ